MNTTSPGRSSGTSTLATSTSTFIPWEGVERLIAVAPEQLRRIPLVIGVAASPHKARAIRGAVRAGMVDALATGVVTARAILDLAP